MIKDILEEAVQSALCGERICKDRDVFLYICAWGCVDLRMLCKIRRRSVCDPDLNSVFDNIDMLIRDEMVKDDEEELGGNRHLRVKVMDLLKQYHEQV